MMNAIHFSHLTWKDVETRLGRDVRIVIPLGATEEHAHLSLTTDSMVVEHVAHHACSEAGVICAPTVPFGCSAFSVHFPGTISLRTITMVHLIEDIIDNLYRQGFRRLIFVTGHGGNEVITGVLSEAQMDRSRLCIHYLQAMAGAEDEIRRIESEHGYPPSEHASWHEDFPFTRIYPSSDSIKDPINTSEFPLFPLNPRTARKYLVDGVVGGKYTLGHIVSEKLLAFAISHFANLLKSIPPGPPDD
jgi:creatinine amidohydrolase